MKSHDENVEDSISKAIPVPGPSRKCDRLGLQEGHCDARRAQHCGNCAEQTKRVRVQTQRLLLQPYSK